MVKLELTEPQAGALLQLLDLAIKSGGLNVAEAGVFFNNLIQPQLQPQDDRGPEITPEEEVDKVIK